MTPVPVAVAIRAIREQLILPPRPEPVYGPFDVLVGRSGEIVTDWQLSDTDRR